MILKRLELYGFKSFADKVEIEFDNGITGVVGPNGSGKSNIGDAVRWVLGEQSAKSLRGSKMEDVIFNGAQKRDPMSICEVTLIFDNTDKTVTTEYSELSVTRRFYRTGESEYLINKQKCRRKEIIDMFRDTGVGKEGYSIIGQGRIENIISAKPEGRRDIFHEAVGIMKHRSKRDESNRSLAHTRDNIQRLVDKMEEMERQLKPLKRQCDNARRYLTISEQLKNLEVNRFLVNYKKLNENNTTFSDQLNKLVQIETDGLKFVEQSKEDISKRQLELHETRAKIESLTTEIAELTREIDFEENEIKLINERINFGVQTKMRLGDEISFADTESKRLLDEAERLEETLMRKRESHLSRTEEINKLKSELEIALNDYNQKQKILDDKKLQLIENVTNLSDIKTAISRYEAMTESLTQRKEAILENIGTIDEDESIYSKSKQEIQANLDVLDKQVKDLQEENNKRTLQLSKLKAEYNSAQIEAREKGVAYKTSENRITILQNMQKDLEGYDRAVKFLMSNDRCQSYMLGILGDLIDVPIDYTKAIDTALGRATQNVVTETDYDAKELIRQLRKNQAGRATFLPLSSIRGRDIKNNERSILNARGCHGVAAELVDYDEKYEEVVYSLLGRTIVCEDMDVAVELSRQCNHSLRFVTLKGDVINAGGSMTGGSTHSRSSSILSRRSEIAELEKQLVFVKQAYKAANTSMDKLSKDIETMESDVSAHSSELNETNIALIRELEKMERLNELWGKNNSSKTTHQKELEEIEANLAELQKDIEEAQNASQVEVNEDQVKEEIAHEQAKLNEMGEDVDELQHQLNTLLIREAADEKELSNVEKEIARLKRSSEKVLTDATKKQNQTSTSDEVIQKQKDEIKDREDTISEIKAKLLSKENELADLTQYKKELSQKLDDANDAYEKSREKLLAVTEGKYKLEGKIDSNNNEILSIQNRMWDMYELTYANALPLKDENFDVTTANDEIDSCRRKIKNMGTVNVNALEDYTQINERYTEHKVQYDDLIKAESDLITVIEDLNEHMLNVFSSEFGKLNEYFVEAFAALFGGGEAKLIIHDEDNVLESGIDIIAQPPGKKLQHLSLLSGGEKALTAIALLFAMLRHRPSPFCLLDEIEAALDEANLNHFAQYVKDYSDNTQFVIVTHRRGTMEACDRLYGVTMEEKGVSKMISVQISDYE